MAVKEMFEQNTEKIILSRTLLADLSDRTGAYVWKKYSNYVSFGMTQLNTNSNPVTFQMISTVTDLSAVDASWFVGVTGEFSTDGGSTWSDFSIKEDGFYTGTSLRGTVSYNASTQVLSVTASFGTLCLWRPTATYSSLDFVVSDDEEAYPDGAIQDGYWYERIALESFNIDYGIVTPTSTVYSITVNHALKVAPKYYGIFAVHANTTATLGIFSEWTVRSGAVVYNTGNSTCNADTITFQFTVGGFQAATAPYIWFAIAYA